MMVVIFLIESEGRIISHRKSRVQLSSGGSRNVARGV
jgi:hypothetical protein